MGFLIRAGAFLANVRDWFTFANEVFSWVGGAQRVAAATALGAAVAVPAMVATDTLPFSSKVSVVVENAASSAPTTKVEIDGDRYYGELFLMEEANHPITYALVKLCAEKNKKISDGQCEVADRARWQIEYLAKREAERQRIIAEQKATSNAIKNGGLNGWAGPSDTQMFKKGGQ